MKDASASTSAGARPSSRGTDHPDTRTQGFGGLGSNAGNAEIENIVRRVRAEMRAERTATTVTTKPGGIARRHLRSKPVLVWVNPGTQP
jgi:hypothetical protein